MGALHRLPRPSAGRVHGAVPQGPRLQHLPHRRLLLDPPLRPSRPLRQHLPRRLDAQPEVAREGEGAGEAARPLQEAPGPARRRQPGRRHRRRGRHDLPGPGRPGGGAGAGGRGGRGRRGRRRQRGRLLGRQAGLGQQRLRGEVLPLAERVGGEAAAPARNCGGGDGAEEAGAATARREHRAAPQARRESHERTPPTQSPQPRDVRASARSGVAAVVHADQLAAAAAAASDSTLAAPQPAFNVGREQPLGGGQLLGRVPCTPDSGWPPSAPGLRLQV